MDIKIITDGGADLPRNWIQSEDIGVVPLSIHFQEASYRSTELNGAQFFEKMRSQADLPRTSSPSPHDFYIEFSAMAQLQRPVVAIVLSSGLSSTYQSAEMAKQMVMDEHPEAIIEVIDSKTASAGMVLLIHQAIQLKKSELPFAELVERLKQIRAAMQTTFYLETLENVIKGGRLDRLRGAIASVMNIKLVMDGSEEGKIQVLEKVRGSSKAIKRLISMVGERTNEFKYNHFMIAHGNCEEKAKTMAEEIMKTYPFQGYFLVHMGPVIGTYGGEGSIVLAYK